MSRRGRAPAILAVRRWSGIDAVDGSSPEHESAKDVGAV